MINVLIAEDSKLTRMVLRDLLAGDSQIHVVGEVDNGRAAVAETLRLKPNLVIMDIMMPVMDGLEAVEEIMAHCPTPILILSANVDRGDNLCAFNAIERGALDVMEKPRGVVTEAFDAIATRLIEKVKTLSRVRVITHFRKRKRHPEALTPAATIVPPPLPPATTFHTLAIGASTGGPRAVMKLITALPKDISAGVAIVQHISNGFDRGFAEWLNRESQLTVRLARAGDKMEPGLVLLAPNGTHMEIHRQRVQLIDDPPVNCCKPAVDKLFHSLASKETAPGVLGVLLTGMGCDGAEGMLAMKKAGAYNIVQDEASCAVFGMPRVAAERGAAHRVLPLDDIPPAVVQLLKKR
ncbi:MAG: chemotaxis-specific protein-glutamate methyltransferase CheB [Desulfuromonadaceae bacterium]|nr:chemotaxis-specific protein-glutamate methyltransferase CheB [Desulfuromonadaceae bacterium]